MPKPRPAFAIAIVGEVLSARRQPEAPLVWLDRLAAELDGAYGRGCLAPFRVTSSGELQGLVASAADPLDAVLRAALAEHAAPMCWVLVAGSMDSDGGLDKTWAPDAVAGARDALARARAARERLVVVSGDPARDALLADVTPVFAALLADLTDRQRAIARLIVVDGLRQAEAATRLDISRPTVSVAVGRAHLRELLRLADAIRVQFAMGTLTASAAATNPATGPTAVPSITAPA